MLYIEENGIGIEEVDGETQGIRIITMYKKQQSTKYNKYRLIDDETNEVIY